MFDLLNNHHVRAWQDDHSDGQPHFPFVVYQILALCVRKVVQFQQDLTTILELETDSPGNITFGCIRLFNRFRETLKHKIDTDAIWAEVPLICPNHNLPRLRTHPGEKRGRPSNKREVKELNDVNAGKEKKDPKCKNIKNQIVHVHTSRLLFQNTQYKLLTQTSLSFLLLSASAPSRSSEGQRKNGLRLCNQV